jgi:hypothetical protein
MEYFDEHRVPIMMLLGYSPVTVDIVDWTYEYARTTMILSKAFYESFKSLKIIRRLLVCEYIKTCRQCYETVSVVKHQEIQSPKCGHNRVSDMHVVYTKYNGLIRQLDVCEGSRVMFLNGVPKYTYCSNTNVNTISHKIKQELMPTVFGNEILPIVQPVVKIGWIGCKYRNEDFEVIYHLWYANYRINIDGQFVKNAPHTITRGDTMVVYGDCSLNFPTPPPPGIRRIYLVDNLGDRCMFHGCVDEHGIQDVYDDGDIRFLPFGHPPDQCFGFYYDLNDLTDPQTPAEIEAKRTHCWDFSTPIPQYLVDQPEWVEDCCQHLIA